MADLVLPAVPVYQRELDVERWRQPPVLQTLKEKARAAGLWNLFLPPSPEHDHGELRGAGLSNLEYAPLAEEMGRVTWASEVFNCSAPDTGNMEVLHRYGTREQQERWLKPLLEGEIRSAYAMTEPEVASSDATNIRTRIERDGDHYVINGRKWWISGVGDPHCRIMIVMGRSNPDAPRHQQASQILVPLDTPAAPRMALRIIDDAIQAFGAGGLDADAGTAALFARVRALRIADGPDEVHARTIALLEQKRYQSA